MMTTISSQSLSDDLPRAMRRRIWRAACLLAVAAAHLAAGYALLHVAQAIVPEDPAAPIFVEFVRPAPEPVRPVPPPAPKPAIRKDPPVIASSAPAQTPQEIETPPPEPEPAPEPVHEPVQEIAPPAPAPVAPEAPIQAAPAPAPPAPEPKLVSSVEYVRAPRVNYPKLSQRLHEQGQVVVRVLITPRGVADQAVIHRSSGFPRLDQAAIEAVLGAIYKPRFENGKPVPVYAHIPINFTM